MLWMILAVGAGGAIGAILRFLVQIMLVNHYAADSWLATLMVNILGCFLMGMMASFASLSGSVPEPLRGFLAIGLFGALTTFSSFALDNWGFVLRGSFSGAFLYSTASIGLSLLAFAGGILLMRAVFGIIG